MKKIRTPLKESKRKVITDIEEHRQKHGSSCGKSRVEGSLELGASPTLRAL